MIIRSTIDLARHLGLLSTAEGVETEEAQHWLRSAGCNLGQGYGIAMPMTPADATAWLKRHLADRENLRTASAGG